MSFINGSFFRYLFGVIVSAIFAVTVQAEVTRFVVTESGGTTKLGTTPIKAGVPILLRITAVDDSGSTVTTYNNKVTIKLADPRQPNTSWASASAVLVNGVVNGVSIIP